MRNMLVFSFFVMFVIGTDTFLISPLLPMLQHKFSVLPEFSGWMVGAYSLGYFLFALIAGPLSDNHNRKTVFLSGMLGFTVATFLCGTATGFWTMCLYRFLAGVSAAFTTPQIWAMLTTLVPKEQLVRAIGVGSAGLAVSQVLGVPLGSYLAQFQEATPFWALSGCALLLFLIGFRLVPSLLPTRTNVRVALTDRYVTLFRLPAAKRSFFAYFVLHIGGFAAFSYLGTWLHDAFSLGNIGVGSVMMFLGLGNLTGSLGGGWLVRKFGMKNVLFSAYLGVVVLYLILPHLTTVRSVQIAYFCNFLLVGLLLPITMSLLQSLSASLRGTIASLTSAVMYAGSTVGSGLAGLLYAKLGGFVTVCLLASVCFGFSLVLFQRRFKQVPQQTGSLPQSS